MLVYQKLVEIGLPILYYFIEITSFLLLLQWHMRKIILGWDIKMHAQGIIGK
jgi:hypothetical protein